MSSTDLATIASQLPAHLQGKKPQALEEFAGGMSQGMPLPSLSIRGKEFRLRKDGQEVNTRQREISVIFVAARRTKSKRFYIKKYESGSAEAPDCSSADSVTPDVAEPVHPNCTHCPKNQWGSRVSEAGKESKACSDYKRIIVWAIGIHDEPLVLDVPATSIKAPKSQKHTVMMMGDYLGQLAKHGMDPTQVVTKIGLTDAEYPQMYFTFERFVDEKEWLNVQELRDSEDVNACIDNPLFEEGKITPDPSEAEPEEKPKATRTRKPKEEKKPEPEPEPVKMPEETAKGVDFEKLAREDEAPDFPGKTTIMKNGADMEIAEDEATWAELWAEGYRPKEARKPKAEPMPETVAAGHAGDDEPAAEPAEGDLLSEVAKLLGKK